MDGPSEREIAAFWLLATSCGLDPKDIEIAVHQAKYVPEVRVCVWLWPDARIAGRYIRGHCVRAAPWTPANAHRGVHLYNALDRFTRTAFDVTYAPE